MKTPASALVGLTAFAFGCEPSEVPDQAVTVRDSAGVTIVESKAPQWSTPDEAWSLSNEPILEIGAISGEPPYLLSNVMGVMRFDDGRVAIANMGDNTIRFYSPDGRFVRSSGPPG